MLDLQAVTLSYYLALVRQAYEGNTTGAWSDPGRVRLQHLVRDWREAGMPVGRLVNVTHERGQSKWPHHVHLDASSAGKDSCGFDPYDWYKRNVLPQCNAAIPHYRKEFVTVSGVQTLRSGQDREQAVARLYIRVWIDLATEGKDFYEEHGPAFDDGKKVEDDPDIEAAARAARAFCWLRQKAHGAAVIDLVGSKAHEDPTYDLDFDVSSNADKAGRGKGGKTDEGNKDGKFGNKGSINPTSRASIIQRKKDHVLAFVNNQGGSKSSATTRVAIKQASATERMAVAVHNVSIADENANSISRYENEVRAHQADVAESIAMLKDPVMLELLAADADVEVEVYKKTVVLPRYKAAAEKVRSLRAQGPPTGTDAVELPDVEGSGSGSNDGEESDADVKTLMKNAGAEFDKQNAPADDADADADADDAGGLSDAVEDLADGDSAATVEAE